ncbi:MAG: thiopurine S-methyltransferase [Pseudomonadales bacterium]
MKPKFWLERWQKNQIGFHQAAHNPLLMEYWPTLNLPASAPVFVPLCGKSLDMQWLAEAGHPVIGVELAQLAVETFFANGPPPSQSSVDRFVCYQRDHTAIYQGDFFDLTSSMLRDVQGVFDRGSLVALPRDMRFRYVDHMLRIVPDGARILLLTLEYDQAQVSGPPHAVQPEEVESLFGLRCEIQHLETFVTSTLPPHFQAQGVRQAAESVFLITKVD